MVMNDETDMPSNNDCDKQEIVEEIEPFNFLDLPRDIQLLICRQLDLNTYLNLLRTSKQLRRSLKLISKTLLFEKETGYVSYYKRRLRVMLYKPLPNMPSDLKWDQISGIFVHSGFFKITKYTWEQLAPSPVTIVTECLEIRTPLTDEKFNKLSKLFNTKRLKTNSLDLQCKNVDNMENVLNLIDLIKPVELFTQKPWPDHFYLDPRLKSVKSLCINHDGTSAKLFFSLKIPQEIHMFGTVLTHESLHKYLMELYKGIRSVSTVVVGYNNSLFDGSYEYDLMTRDILLPIWTEATHHLSLLKDYPIFDVRAWNVEQMFYLFPRNSKGLEHYLVQFDADDMTVRKTTDMYYGYSRFPSHVASKVFKKCMQCRQTYCEHRRKWSVARIREKYPTIYKILIKCFSIAEILVTGLCFSTTIVKPEWFIKRENGGYSKFFEFEFFWSHPIVKLLEIL